MEGVALTSLGAGWARLERILPRYKANDSERSSQHQLILYRVRIVENILYAAIPQKVL